MGLGPCVCKRCLVALECSDRVVIDGQVYGGEWKCPRCWAPDKEVLAWYVNLSEKERWKFEENMRPMG